MKTAFTILFLLATASSVRAHAIDDELIRRGDCVEHPVFTGSEGYERELASEMPQVREAGLGDASPIEVRALRKNLVKEYRLNATPRYWMRVIGFSVLGENRAHADSGKWSTEQVQFALSQLGKGEGLSAGEIVQLRDILNGEDQGQGQQGSSGGSGSGGGGGGSGGGGGGGQALFGIAALIAASSPIAVSAITASADVEKAKINTEGAVAMTQIASDTAKFNADATKESVLGQAEAYQQTNSFAQGQQTLRLGMQLDALDRARQMDLTTESDKLAYQAKLQRQQIELARADIDAKRDAAFQMARLQTTLNSMGTRSQDLKRSQNGLAAQPLGGLLASAATAQGGAVQGGSLTRVLKPAKRASRTKLTRVAKAARPVPSSRGASFEGRLAQGSSRDARQRALASFSLPSGPRFPYTPVSRDFTPRRGVSDSRHRSASAIYDDSH